MTDIDTGLHGWQQSSNHNRMIELQEKPAAEPPRSTVELAYFGSSAFRVVSPEGISIMLDPWRNHPVGKWDWYFHDFPSQAVDIGVSTHAHFDHDALHRLDAHVLLDRLIGTYSFRDVTITGIADKHASDSSAASYDFRKIIKSFHGVDIRPPDNPRSWDNCLVVIDTGALRILHWGDNRHNPPEQVWDALGEIDVLLIPIDDSQHVLSFDMVDGIIDRLKPAVTVPHHYYIWDVVQRQSTLMPVTEWLKNQSKPVTTAESASVLLDSAVLDSEHPEILYFGDHVAFDKEQWMAAGI